MNPKTELHDLSDFYKYCMNTVMGIREPGQFNPESDYYKYSNNAVYLRKGQMDPTQETVIEWHAWMRCRITPYLVNNKVVKPDYLVENLLYSLTDYLEYCSCFSGRKSTDLDLKTARLIKFIESNKDNLVELIEGSAYLFPSVNDTKHANKLDEHWNDCIYENERHSLLEEYKQYQFYKSLKLKYGKEYVEEHFDELMYECVSN